MFDAPASAGTDDKKGPGPVQQGVGKQLRHLEKQAGDPEAWRASTAGWAAQARSLARAIDRASGHNGGKQAAGMQLSAMHHQLDELLQRLAPAHGQQLDPFDELLDKLDELDELDQDSQADGSAASPHSA